MKDVYIGDKVKLTDQNGDSHEGEIILVQSSEYTDSGEDEITVENEMGIATFEEKSIKELEVLN